MSREAKILVAVVAFIAVGFGLARMFYRDSESTQMASNRGITLKQEFVRDDSWKLGPADAPVTIVEFLDPECESCKAYYPIMKSVLEKYKGKVHFVVRYMTFHRSSQMAVAATEAAGLQNKYWEMQELLFERAEEWGHQETPRRDLFVKYAKELGLGTDKFELDLDDPKWIIKAQRDMADGRSLGVQSTPTIFINGVVLGDLSYEALDDAVRKLTAF